ncbi:SWIM zinc finger family protein [Rhodopirellula baltica]
MAVSVKGWQTLTWSTLESWTGSRTIQRGEDYQKQGRVRKLVLCGDGSIIATVQGTESYITRVSLNTKKRSGVQLSSYCSCPVGYDCKHGVATVLKMIADCEAGKRPPSISDTDVRFEHLQDDNTTPAPKPSSGASKKQRTTDKQIREYLADESKENLIDRLMKCCSAEPSIRRTLADEVTIASGHFDKLLAEAYKEMRKLTAEEAWYDAWDGEGELPDYSGLQKRMTTLLAAGHADELVKLGKELMTRGTDQVNRGHDDGSVCGQLCECMETVAKAIRKSSLTDEQRLLVAFDLSLDDDYDLAASVAELFQSKWPKSAWSSVADELIVRLHSLPAKTDRHGFVSPNRQREQTGSMAIHALRACGRDEEAREISVAEALTCGSFMRAVKELMDDGFDAEAEELAYRGLRETDLQFRGIIHHLQELIGELASKRKEWKIPAAIAAEDFFESPSVDGFEKLLQASNKAKCKAVIETAARRFLETGKRPDLDRNQMRRTKATKAWPLPRAPLGQDADQPVSETWHDRGPHYDVLIGLSIKNGSPNETLRLYDTANANSSDSRFHSARIDRLSVAKSVEKSHPERAIEIYLREALSVAAQTNTKTYPLVGKHLKKVKTLLFQNNRQAEWENILADFKTKHGRKPRLMEVIDRIDRDRIASSMSKR